ncbi:hypothetical protein D3C75_243530 [compost metagenome]
MLLRIFNGLVGHANKGHLPIQDALCLLCLVFVALSRLVITPDCLRQLQISLLRFHQLKNIAPQLL